MAYTQIGNPYSTQDAQNEFLKNRISLAIAGMNTENAVGYGLGKLLSNYLARGNDNKAAGVGGSSGTATGSGTGDTSSYGSGLSTALQQALSSDQATNTSMDNSTVGMKDLLSGASGTTPSDSAAPATTATSLAPSTTDAIKQILATNTPNTQSIAPPASQIAAPQQQITPVNAAATELQNAAASAAASTPSLLSGAGSAAASVADPINGADALKSADVSSASLSTDGGNAGGATSLLSGIQNASGAVKSVENVANGNGSLADILNIYKAGSGLGLFSNAPADNSNTGTAAEKAITSPYLQAVADKSKNDILYAKQLYDSASKKNDANGMAQAQGIAQSARNLAGQYGIDMSNYGADQTLQQASQAQSPMVDVKKAIDAYTGNPMSAQEYWQQLYDQVRAKGVGNDAANKYASQRAAVYQAQKVADLSSQFNQYGVSQDDSVNPLGMQMLSQIATEDPDLYAKMLGSYGTPRDNYAFNRDVQKANLDERLKEKNADNTFMLTEKGADNNLARTKNLEGYKANLSVDTQAKLAQIKVATAGMELNQKYATMYQAAKQLGLTDDAAKMYALSGGTSVSNAQKNAIETAKYIDGKDKEQYERLRNKVKDFEKVHENDPNKDWMNDPDYQSDKDNLSKYTEPKYDFNNYKDGMSFATDLLASHRTTKQGVINTIKATTGDMADNIIGSIDWDEWGY